jgi:hypothetical protein
MGWLSGVLLALSFVGCAVLSAATIPLDWPRVAPLSESFFFPDASKAGAKLYIRGINGEPIYVLECHTYGYEGNSKFDYSGDFECSLGSIYPVHDSYSTLLTYDPIQTRDWESRARVFAEELYEACADYPEYGRERNFRLRGMKLSFKFSDVQFTRDRLVGDRPRGSLALRSFRFDVQVVADPTAVSQIAEDVPFEEPPRANPDRLDDFSRSCSTVKPKHIPGIITADYISGLGLGGPYPQIVPAEKTVDITSITHPINFEFKSLYPEATIFYGALPADEALVHVPVVDVKGKTVYEFQCSANYGPGGLIDRWGIICGLFPIGKTINLLGDSIDICTRMARYHFLPWQLFGRCASYPEWGAVRHFRLRGLMLTVKFDGVTFHPKDSPPDMYAGGITGARILAQVQPDPDAASPVAQPVPERDLCGCAGGTPKRWEVPFPPWGLDAEANGRRALLCVPFTPSAKFGGSRQHWIL